MNVVIDPAWQTLLREHRLDSVAAVYALTGGQVIKPGTSTEVRRLTLDGHDLFIKKYWVTRPNQLISGITRGMFFGISKVRREFENLRQLREWGLNAPAPVAYGEQRRAGWLMRSFLISESVADAVSLDAYIKEMWERPFGRDRQLSRAEARSHKQELINNLADYTRRMHEHHFVHHDYFWRNILLTGNDLTKFFLIDSHKGRCWRSDDDRHRATDLAALDAPAPAFFRRAERLRFFKRYVGHPRLTEADKRLLRLTLQLAEPQRATQLRRVRNARPHQP